MVVKRFKTYLLTEGFGAVKRDYVKTGKITEDDLKFMQAFLTRLEDKTGKMGEWLARWWVTNRGKIKSIKGLDNKPAFIDLKAFETQTYQHLSSVIFEYLELKQSGAIKGQMPKDKMPKDIQEWLNKEANKYYSKKKMKIHSALKKGEDYEEVYNKDGIQVFKIMSHEAASSIGKGTKWCITETSPKYWTTYTSGEGLRFYYIRNHRYSSNIDIYKLAVAVTKQGRINSVWDASDVNQGSDGIPKGWDIPLGIFKWFKDVKGGFDILALDKDFKAWIKDLTGWYHSEFNKERLEWAKEHDEYIKFHREWDDLSMTDDSEEGKKWVKDMKKYLKDPVGFMEEVLGYGFDGEYFAGMYNYEEYNMNDELADFYRAHFGNDASDFWSAIEYAIISGDKSAINYYKPSSIYDD